LGSHWRVVQRSKGFSNLPARDAQLSRAHWSNSRSRSTDGANSGIHALLAALAVATMSMTAVDTKEIRQADCFWWYLFPDNSKTKKKKKKKDSKINLDSISDSNFESPSQKRKKRADKLIRGAEQTEQSITMVTQEEIAEITSLLNQLIDLDFFDEESEERIFRSCVDQIIIALEDIMPIDYHMLVQSCHPLGGLSAGQAKELERRLVHSVRRRVEFPFLDPKDERRVVQFVVTIVTQVMREDRELNLLLYGDSHGDNQSADLIINVLMKGAVSKLFEASEKEALIEELSSGWVRSNYIYMYEVSGCAFHYVSFSPCFLPLLLLLLLLLLLALLILSYA
jgi:hypothetical protein